MKNLLIAIIFILGTLNNFVNAQQQDKDIDMAVYNKFKNIEQSKFGKTLIDTLAVQLGAEAKDPAGDLIQLLQDIEDNIRQEQDEDDQYVLRLQQECDENLARLQAEIDNAKERSAELQAELDEKVPIRDQKNQQLADKNEFRDMLQQKIAEIDQRKLLKDQEWEEEQEQHDHATATIEKVKEIIESSMKSFLQSGSTALTQVSSTLRSNLKNQNYKRKSWNSFFSLLADLTADLQPQADQATVKKVIQLCDDILDKISESREIERKDYQHWVEAYTNHRNGLLEKLENTNNKINELQLQISTLNKRIADANYEKSEQDKRAQDKQELHDEKLQYCEDENKGYAERRESRDDERSIVSQTIGLLQANLRTFRKYIKDRQNASKPI